MMPETLLEPETTTLVTAGPNRVVREDPPLVRWLLILAAVSVIVVLVVIPVIFVFVQAFAAGPLAYWNNLTGDPDTRHSILLTLTVVPVAVGANLLFGIAAAWLIARFRFPGRTVLTTLIDVPFSVSPVVAGLMFVLIFGLQGYLGSWLQREGNRTMPYVVAVLSSGVVYLVGSIFWRPSRRIWLRRLLLASVAVGIGLLLFGLQKQFGYWPENQPLKVIFATPGLILATAFVTAPFVARELIPVMEAVGSDEELAALSLGASGPQMFWWVTLPNIKWGLLYGLILCNARAMGEFGAAYVVSGHVAGQTDTMPLRVEKLFQSFGGLPAAFAVASVLTLLALVTLVLKSMLETRSIRHVKSAARRGKESVNP